MLPHWTEWRRPRPQYLDHSPSVSRLPLCRGRPDRANVLSFWRFICGGRRWVHATRPSR